jgi:WD40 repeat protein
MLAGVGGNALFCWTRSRGWEKTGLEHDGPITGVAFHPNGRTLAYAGIANRVAAPPPAPRPTSENVWRRRLAKESRRWFTGVHLYSLTGTDEFVPNRVTVPLGEGAISPESWARGLAFTPDGRTLLAAEVESVGLFRSRTNVLHWHFTEGVGVWRTVDAVAGRAQTERGAVLVGNSCLAVAGAWGVATCPVPGPAGLFVPDVGAAVAAAAAPHCGLIALYRKGRLTVWHLGRAEAVVSVPAESIARPFGTITAIALGPDGETLAVGDPGGNVTTLATPTGKQQSVYDFGVGSVRSLAYAPDGLTLSVAGDRGLVVVDVG